jgi:uncharacterized protein (TIGR02217 family)
MAFHDVLIPAGFEYTSVSGAGFSTIVQETASGHEFRVARQAQGRHRFRLSKALQSATEASGIKAFALGRRGSLHSFRIKDFSDYTTASDGISDPTNADVIIGTGNGTLTTFQLIKVYDITGPAAYQRTISLPVSGTVVVSLDGAASTAFTVSGTGEVVMNAAPSASVVVRAGCKFDVPVRFTSEVDGWAQLQVDAFEVWSIPTLDCIEVLSEVEQPERWFAGGATDHGEVAVTQVLSLNGGMLHRFDPTADINVYLPPVARIPGGGQIFVIDVPTGASHDVQLVDETGTNVGSAISETTKIVGLARGATTATWIVY